MPSRRPPKRARRAKELRVGLHCFAESEAPARRLGQILGASCEPVEVHVFPDGERRVRVAETPAHAVLYRSLNDAKLRDPDDKLIEVLLAASALRARGAARLTLVAPYLSYMRQDVAFHAGEAVSQKVIGAVLGAAFDSVIAVDPHLHRTHDLDAVFGPGKGRVLSAAPAFVGLLRAEKVAPETVVIGPDAESIAQVRLLAGPLGLDFMVAEKRRSGDREVAVALPDSPALAGRPVILFDDMVSTGATLARCAVAALGRGAASVEALAVHALYGPEEAAVFEASGIRRLRSSDSLAHPSNAVFLGPLIAAQLRGPAAGPAAG